MRIRQVRTVCVSRRSPIEPDNGILSGTGTDILTLTLRGSRDTEMILAERGFISALLAWARTHDADLSSLDPLLGAARSFTSAELSGMEHQLTHLLQTAGDEPGWSLLASSTDEPSTYEGGLIPTTEPTVLVSTPTAAVAVDRDGLRLRLRGITILGWLRDADRIVLRTQSDEYPLRTTTITATLLHRLAHGHTHATLVRRPVGKLAIPLLVGLHSAAAIATDNGAPASLTTTRPYLGVAGERRASRETTP